MPKKKAFDVKKLVKMVKDETQGAFPFSGSPRIDRG